MPIFENSHITSWRCLRVVGQSIDALVQLFVVREFQSSSVLRAEHRLNFAASLYTIYATVASASLADWTRCHNRHLCGPWSRSCGRTRLLPLGACRFAFPLHLHVCKRGKIPDCPSDQNRPMVLPPASLVGTHLFTDFVQILSLYVCGVSHSAPSKYAVDNGALTDSVIACISFFNSHHLWTLFDERAFFHSRPFSWNCLPTHHSFYSRL